MIGMEPYRVWGKMHARGSDCRLVPAVHFTPDLRNASDTVTQ